MNKKQLLLLYVLISFGSMLLKAQTYNNEKTPIGLYPFISDNNKDYLDMANILTGTLQDVLVKNPNFFIVNRTVLSVANSEITLQKQEEFIQGDIAKQGVQQGALKVITGKLNSIIKDQTSRKVGDNTITTYTTTVSFTISLIDVASGKTDNSQTFNLDAKSIGGNFTNSNESIQKQAKKRLTNWVVTLLPYNFTILRIDESDKKGLPSKVTISGGTSLYLEKNEKLIVSVSEDIQGFKSISTIGELSVTLVKGEVSECKVTKGAEAILASMTGKQPLIITFKESE